MNRFFTLLLAASCLTAVGQECADDIYPPIFTGELTIPEGLEENSYEIIDVTLTYASVKLFLTSETINYVDLENPELFMPIHEDNCTDSLNLNWQQFPHSGGCPGAVFRRYFFSDSNGNQTDSFGVIITLVDDDGPYIIQGPNNITLDCSNSLYYQEALDWFENGGGIVAGDSVATFLEGSVEANSLDLVSNSPNVNIIAEYDVSAIIAGEPATIEVVWRVLDQCDNVSTATSLLILECGPNVEGCLDEMACNYSPSAIEEDGSCLYLDDCFVCGGDNSSCTGCLDSQACNYNDTTGVLSDPALCDYSCCPGPGCCGAGTTWNWETSECDVTNLSDSNFDGCVQLNDLLDLLSAYGDCGVEESPWQCGDPLEYQVYDYETVQIGERCWFAENLRNEHYQNGDTIPTSLSDNDWGLTSSGAVAVYEENPSNVEVYGRLYNWHAVDDARGLCPSGWHVPTDGEWITMEMALGMSEAEANQTGFKGTDEGAQLKASPSDSPSWNGSNSSGFSGLPCGYRWTSPSFGDIGIDGIWWSSTPTDQSAWVRYLRNSKAERGRYLSSHNYGFSVRCLKDAE